VCPQYCAMHETVFRAIQTDPDALPDVDEGGDFRVDAATVGQQSAQKTKNTQKSPRKKDEQMTAKTAAIETVDQLNSAEKFEPQVGTLYRFTNVDGTFEFVPFDAAPRSDEHCLSCELCGNKGFDCGNCVCDGPSRADGRTVAAVYADGSYGDDAEPERELSLSADSVRLVETNAEELRIEDVEDEDDESESVDPTEKFRAWERKIREIEEEEVECAKMEALAKEIAKTLKKRRQALEDKRREYTREGADQFDDRDDRPLLRIAEQVTARQASDALERGGNVADTLEAMRRASVAPLEVLTRENWRGASVDALECLLSKSVYDNVYWSFTTLGELSDWLNEGESRDKKDGLSKKAVAAIEAAFRTIFEPIEREEEEKAARLAAKREKRRKSSGDKAKQKRNAEIKAEIEEAIRAVETRLLAPNPPEEIDAETFAKIATKWRVEKAFTQDEASTLRRYFETVDRENAPTEADLAQVNRFLQLIVSFYPTAPELPDGFDEAELAKISARWKAKGTLSRAQFEWLAKYANAFTTALAEQTPEPANGAA
ncbi:MAG: hypothetical protein IJE97_16785, partial [Thermoguttaceae bacterium]|nr:hypothetical protein [Thermoguttaceae bacterium]